MANLRYANFIEGEIKVDLSDKNHTLVIDPDLAKNLPPLSAGEAFNLVIFDGQQFPEVVQCSSWDLTGNLYVSRGEENTQSKSWPAGSFVRLATTAALLDAVQTRVDGAVGELQDKEKQSLALIESKGSQAVNAAQSAASASEVARDAAEQAGKTQPTVAAGIAAYKDGEYFTVPDDSLAAGFRLYRISDGAAIPQPSNDVLRRNESSDISQVVGAGDGALQRMTAHGDLIIPGASSGLQNAVMGKSLAEYHNLIYWRETYRRDVPNRELLFARWKAENELQPARQSSERIVPPDDLGAKLQRLPSCEEITPGVLFVVNSQVAANSPNTDGDGLRLVGRWVHVENGTVVSIGDAIVIDEPADWANGHGSSAPECVFATSDGKALVVFKQINGTLNEDGVHRSIATRTVSQSGSVSSRKIIADGAKYGDCLGTANGSSIVLANGPNAGRWLMPVYLFPTDDGQRLNVIYSDDQGKTWQFGEPIAASAGFTEWAIVQQPDGSLVGNARGGSVFPRLYCPAENGGISGWQITNLDNSIWTDYENNRSMYALSLSPERGTPGVVWCSTIRYDTNRQGRKNLGLRFSFDDFTTLQLEYTFGFKEMPAGYSCIRRLVDGSFFVVFETGFNGPPVEIRAHLFNAAEVIKHGDAV